MKDGCWEELWEVGSRRLVAAGNLFTLKILR